MPFPFTKTEEDQIDDENDAANQRVILTNATVTP